MFYTVNVKHESEHDIPHTWEKSQMTEHVNGNIKPLKKSQESTDRIKHLRKIMLGLNEGEINMKMISLY